MRHIKPLAVSLILSAFTAGVALAAGTPTVSTGSAKNITDASAALTGSVNPQGNATTYLFQVGPAAGNYTVSTAGHSAGSGSRTVAAEAVIASLAPATVYHYRIAASSKAGTSLGADRTFTTGGHPAPGATTGPPTQVGHSFAVVSGAIATNGQATTYVFQYGTGPGYSAQSMGGTVPASSTPVAVSDVLRGLSGGTTFHYRLVALHGLRSNSLGADATFTTTPYPRFVPRVRAHTLPTIAASRPYTFITNGTLLRPSRLPGNVGCSGTVGIRFVSRHRTRAIRTAVVQPDCTFAASVTFHRLVGRSKAARRLRVEIRYHGNEYLIPAAARPERVILGLP